MFKNSINDNGVVLPQAPDCGCDGESGEIFRRFSRHLCHVPVSRMEIKILSAIQFTADMMDMSDAHVSKILVEMGLRAPRLAFPMEFLDYADKALMRRGWSVGAPGDAMIALQGVWFSMQKECGSSPFRHIHTVVEQDLVDV